MSRYVVIGAGAVGATLAAELHEAGTEVVLVARGAQLAALREGPLRHLRPDGEHLVTLAVVGSPHELDLRTDDVLVLATKAQDADAALADWAWRPVAGGASAAESLPVVILQNGLDSERAALRRFATVYGSAVWSPASYLTAGEVVSPAEPVVGVLWIGRYPGGGPDGADTRLEEIAADLRGARHLVEVVADVPRWKAGKLLPILANALDALYPAGRLRDRAAAALRAEALRVYAAAGIDAADLARDTALDLSGFRSHPVPGRAPSGRSTWQSLHRGAPPETDFLNGEITLLARLHGVEAPRNAAVLAALHRAAGQGAGALDEKDLLDVLPEVDVLVDPEALAGELRGAAPPVLLDVRWALGDPHGREHHRAGHVPGAVYVDLDTELAAHGGDPTRGRHPLPSVEDLQAAARRWGITAGRPVVAYDAGGGLAAARAWWLLRWAGLADVRLLDGGLAAWTAAGLPVETDEVTPEPGDVELSAGHLPVLDADAAAELARSGVLLDARAAERYRGEVEPVDPRAGHVPGAVSAPTGDNLGPDGRFLPAARLRERFAGLDAGPVGVYCGSGVTAAHEIAALAVAGVPAALFPGSWSAWSADPGRPAAVGAAPEGDPA